MIYLFLVIFFAALIGFVLYTRRKRQTRAEEKIVESLAIDVSQNPVRVYTTPEGATVKTVNACPSDAEGLWLAAIDDGLSDLFERTRGRGYSRYQSHKEFTIVCYPPTYYTEVEQNPALTLKDGRTIAGTVISLTNPVLEPPFILIAENWFKYNYLSDAVRNEGEHIVAFYNDKALFEFARGANDVHPIYKKEGEI